MAAGGGPDRPVDRVLTTRPFTEEGAAPAGRSGNGTRRATAAKQPGRLPGATPGRYPLWVKGEQYVPACQYSEADTQKLGELVLVSMLSDGLTLEVDGERWRGLQMMYVKPVGTYTLTCTVSDEHVTSSFSIGDPPRFHDARSRALAGLAASALASLSVLVGAVLTVVIAVRRHLHGR